VGFQSRILGDLTFHGGIQLGGCPGQDFAGEDLPRIDPLALLLPRLDDMCQTHALSRTLSAAIS
jgi:hypothetical protein